MRLFELKFAPNLLLSGILAASSGFIQSAVSAEPDIRRGVQFIETVEHYTINGRTRSEILRSLRRRGPEATGIPGAVGSHTPVFDVSYDPVSDQVGCRVGRLRLKLHSHLKIPQWQPIDALDPKLLAAMRKYEAAVLKHEQTHARIALSYLERLRQRMIALPPAPSCAELGRAILTVRDEEYGRERREQAAFHRLDGEVCWPFFRCPSNASGLRRHTVTELASRARNSVCRKKFNMTGGYGVVRLSSQEFARRCGR